MVYHCTGCDNFTLHPLGMLKINEKNNQTKFGLPVGPPVGAKCEHCLGSHHVSSSTIYLAMQQFSYFL